jgi:hypothetical protein
MYLSGDARKIARLLYSKWPERADISTNEAIHMEQAILTYYPNPILKMMEDMISKAKPDKLDRYADFTYHYPALRRITNKRSSNPPNILDTMFGTVFEYLQNSLLCGDYNYDALLQMIELSKCSDGMASQLPRAVKIAKEAGVYTIPYVYAICQREWSEKQAHMRRMSELDNKAVNPIIKQSDSNMGMIEKISIMARWEQRKENARLENLARRHFNA